MGYTAPFGTYTPTNDFLDTYFDETITLNDSCKWQPLSTRFNQSDPLDVQEFLVPHWSGVTPFAIKEERTTSDDDKLYLDPGAPTCPVCDLVFCFVATFGLRVPTLVMSLSEAWDRLGQA